MDDQMESTLRLMVWGVILLPMFWPFIQPFLFKSGKRGKLEHKQEFLIPPRESDQIAPRILNALKAAGFADQQFTSASLLEVSFMRFYFGVWRIPLTSAHPPQGNVAKV